MKKKTGNISKRNAQSSEPSKGSATPTISNPARIYAVPEEARCLDATQLAKLEQSFRSWARASSRSDTTESRKRILLIFLLIRYTGARLNEVLEFDPSNDVDVRQRFVRYRSALSIDSCSRRKVHVSEELITEIRAMVHDVHGVPLSSSPLKVDAGHVRRKFYERAAECGFSQDLGSPNAIRRARAVELMQNNVPLPVVQRILGHSTPNLTASLVSFSEDDISQVARHFIEKESARRTSARNIFFGKVADVHMGDIQSRIELVTLGGDVVTTVITNNSLVRLGLKPGSLISAEVKAPWVIVQKADREPQCSAENIFRGTVTRIVSGKLITELIVRIPDGTQLCSVVTEQSRRKLDVHENDTVWVMFNSFAVILHAD